MDNKHSIKKNQSAVELPQEWDFLASAYFQRKEFLLHCEKYNPCRQRYYSLYINDQFYTGAIVYTLSLDILTFIGMPSPVKMQVCGVPCSVSAPGIIGDYNYAGHLIHHIHEHEKGFHLTLNLEICPGINNAVTGRTLPSVVLQNTFKDWNIYKESLRSDYRRRFNKIKKTFHGIETRRGTCRNFTFEMYSLYKEVLKRSKGKLETLSFDFFQNLPTAFCLTSYYSENKLTGWYISTTSLPEFYFFLGGIDYKQNPKYQTYFNLLADIIKEGIQKNAAFIELGQTAEIPKMRMGGKLSEKKMIGYHTSKILNVILKKIGGMLEYKSQFTEPDAIKS